MRIPCFGVIVKTACDLVFSCYNIKSIDRARICNVWKNAAVHHPQTFGISGIYYIYVSSAVSIAAPYTVYPTRLVEPFHARFMNFYSGLIEFSF